VEHPRAFIQALDELFKGTVIWMTGSKQASSSQDVFTKDPAFFFADERTRRLDLEIMPIVLAETNWTIYDNYHINEPLAYTSGFFADQIHHPGRLTQLGWEYMLGCYCPTAPPASN
jgi:hypothetical protein